MLTSIAGDGFAVHSGEETDRFSGEEAQRLIEAGAAVPVSEEKIERAVKRKGETRVA